MTRRIYAYLRASTDGQDAERARESLSAFAERHKLEITAWFVENISGNKFERPKLFDMLTIMFMHFSG